MSTNFNRKRRLTPEEKMSLMRAIVEDRIISFSYNEGNDIISSEDLDLDVHIGQNSMGWKFLCDHNNWKFYHDKQSFYEFIKTPKTSIINEYGETVKPDSLIEMIENSLTGKSRKDPKYPEYCTERDGLDWSTDFC